MTREQLFDILDNANTSKLKEHAEDEGCKVFTCPQKSWGQSTWAQWVRDGDLKEEWVIWAWKEAQDQKKTWLGIKLDSGRGKPWHIDLRTGWGRDDLKEAENEYREFLAKSRE